MVPGVSDDDIISSSSSDGSSSSTTNNNRAAPGAAPAAAGPREFFRKCILTPVYVTVTLLYVAFGITSYLFFGGNGRPAVPSVLLEAMTSTAAPFGVLTQIVKVTMSTSLVVQVPIVLFPCWTILEAPCRRWFKNDEANMSSSGSASDPEAGEGTSRMLEVEMAGEAGKDAPSSSSSSTTTTTSFTAACMAAFAPRELARSLYRLAVAGIIAAAACGLGNDFENISALVGAFSNGVIAFILPPFLLLRLKGSHLGCAEKALNVGLLIFGVACTAFATFVVLKNMVEIHFLHMPEKDVLPVANSSSGGAAGGAVVGV